MTSRSQPSASALRSSAAGCASVSMTSVGSRARTEPPDAHQRPEMVGASPPRLPRQPLLLPAWPNPWRCDFASPSILPSKCRDPSLKVQGSFPRSAGTSTRWHHQVRVSVPSSGGKFSRIIPEFCVLYAIVAKISCVVLDSAVVVDGCIDLCAEVASLRDRPFVILLQPDRANTHRITAAGLRKMPTTFDRGLIFRHCTAVLRVRSATSLVGSTPSSCTKVKKWV